MFDNLSAIAGDRYVSTDEMRMHTRFFREMGWTSKKKIPLYKEHEVVLSKGLNSNSKPLELSCPHLFIHLENKRN